METEQRATGWSIPHEKHIIYYDHNNNFDKLST